MEAIGLIMTVVLFVGIALLFLIITTIPKKGGKKSQGFGVNPSLIPGKWAEVQAMMSAGGPANFRQSIMEGDKLVDAVLRNKVNGETMAERLKSARNLFSHETYNALWTAHKIRNKVAHEADFEGLSSDAHLAINGFEKALKELGVI